MPCHFLLERTSFSLLPCFHEATMLHEVEQSWKLMLVFPDFFAAWCIQIQGKRESEASVKWDALKQVASYLHRNAGKGKGVGNPRCEKWHILRFCSVPGDLITVDGDGNVQTELSSCPIPRAPLWWSILAAGKFNYLPCAVKWLKLRLFSSSTLAGHSHSGMTSCFNRSCLPRWQKPSSFFLAFFSSTWAKATN